MIFSGRSVVVTGAGGSIGSQICERAAFQGAKKLTLVSLTESGLYNIERKLRGTFPGVELLPVLGSVNDECLIERAVHGADIVVHAAAHKHVPMCERNPAEAIKNNVFGTETLAMVSRATGVRQFCLISSDKAVQPASIMGATKRVAEMIVGRMGRGFFTVRFGNVLDSAGSVLPLWREQIAAGGPITLTDERCERYFMSIPEAVDLISAVIALRPDSGTFVLDMGAPRKMTDVARDLMKETGKEVPIKFIGLRPGEKLTEELHYGGELVPTDVPRVFRVHEDQCSARIFDRLNDLESAIENCDTDHAKDLLWSMVL